MPPKYNFIDLFCGIGGFHQALSSLGHECVFASDKDKHCRETYKLNYTIEPAGDITKVVPESIPSFDILCAGFPCQPFSHAGYQQGFEDSRGNLFWNICRIVEHHNPRYMILENVKNLATHDKGNTWKIIKNNIDALGYHTYSDVLILNTLHLNVPQNRERVLILCKRKDLGELPPRPTIPKKSTLRMTRAVADIIIEQPRDTMSAKHVECERIWNAFVKLLIDNNVETPKFPIWTEYFDVVPPENDPKYVKYKNWIDKNRKLYTEHPFLRQWLVDSRKSERWTGAVRKMEWQTGNFEAGDCLNRHLWSLRPSGIRVKKADYVPTLVAMNQTPVYGPERRMLSPRELLRCQSFPDDFQYDESRIFKQVGNAVNVDMIKAAARFLIHDYDLLT